MDRENKLAALAAQANAAHGEVEASLRKAIHAAKEAGDALRTAKQRVGHGKWLDWLKVHFDASAETARVYMRISEGWEAYILPVLERGQGLTLAEARLILRRPPKEIENGVIPHAKPWADMSRANLINNFTKWMEDMPEEGVICLHQIWDSVWKGVLDRVTEEMERHRVKD